MNKKDLTFKKKYLKLRTDLLKISKQEGKIAKKIDILYNSFTSKAIKNFNPIFSLLKKHPQFSYKISKPTQIKIFNSSSENLPELILEISLLNLPKSIQPPTNPIDIHVNYYKSSKVSELELEKHILIGKISQFILNNKSKLTQKLTNQSISYQTSLSPLLKIHSEYEKSYIEKYHILKNYHLPIFKEYLKTGITLNHQSSMGFDFLWNFPVNDNNYENVIELKLLENDELLITNLESPNSNVEQVYKEKVDKINDFIKFHFLHTSFMSYIKTPKVYPEILSNLITISRNIVG